MSNSRVERMRIFKRHDPELREAMEKGMNRRQIDELVGDTPTLVAEAADRLGKLTKDEGLRGEVALVGKIAGQRKLLNALNNREKEISENWSKDKIAKHADEVRHVYNQIPLAAEELKRLELQRTMSNEVLKAALVKELC
jgi:hypothetical protein